MTNVSDSLLTRQDQPSNPTTPQRQRLASITPLWFSLFRVRSPLLTESLLFSFPVGTEMFHFPTFPPTALYIQAEVAGHYSGFFRGFPIRRSPDRSSFTSSPGLIAGYNVLHRLLMPRHPPYALHSLSPHTQTQQKQDTPTPLPERRKKRHPEQNSYKDARVHYPTTKQPQKNQRHPAIRQDRLISQGPTVRHPTHPKVSRHPCPGPAVRSTPATPASRRTGSTEHSRPHPRGQHVDDSTSEHPSAVGTNVPRASGVCSLERR